MVAAAAGVSGAGLLLLPCELLPMAGAVAGALPSSSENQPASPLHQAVCKAFGAHLADVAHKATRECTWCCR